MTTVATVFVLPGLPSDIVAEIESVFASASETISIRYHQQRSSGVPHSDLMALVLEDPEDDNKLLVLVPRKSKANLATLGKLQGETKIFHDIAFNYEHREMIGVLVDTSRVTMMLSFKPDGSLVMSPGGKA